MCNAFAHRFNLQIDFYALGTVKWLVEKQRIWSPRQKSSGIFWIMCWFFERDFYGNHKSTGLLFFLEINCSSHHSTWENVVSLVWKLPLLHSQEWLFGLWIGVKFVPWVFFSVSNKEINWKFNSTILYCNY